MAPRKRSAAAAAAAASTRKSNQSNQPSQPSKFGIQHFFERHSQSQAAAAASSTPPNPNPNPKPADPPIPTPAAVPDDPSPQITPEICKSVSLKRFKFSPGMLIKQSQDDGGDEVTWKVSPVNERLMSLASKHLPGMMRNLSGSPRPASSNLQPCSEKQNSSSTSAGMLEKWISSPTAVPSDRSLAKITSLQEPESLNGSNGVSTMEFRSPFRTPPSTAYGPSELISSAACSLASDSLGPGQHRKTLLELLDQVEDAITEEPTPDNSMKCDGCVSIAGNSNMEHNNVKKNAAGVSPKTVQGPSKYVTFLVLEVSEKHVIDDSSNAQKPFKVLRLLDEQSGQERALHLYDNWFYCLIGPGDTVNVIGEFDDQGKCVVSRDANLIILQPDVLLSGTRVASSFSCLRRAILDERLKSAEHSTPALIGTLLHQIFQAGLLKHMPTRQFLEEYTGVVLRKNLESLYACGVNENDIYLKLIEAVPKILNWLKCFRDTENSETANIGFAKCSEKKTAHISEVIDIEEVAWAPRYGLKGMIDASIRTKLTSKNGSVHETIMPLEFKTGKGTTGQSAVEHQAQVTLYTLLMSERYLKKDIDQGLLYYLHTDQTLGIKVQRSDLVGLLGRRNELATELLKASSTQVLPPMLQNLAVCKGCRHLNICALYHKAHGGNTESSGLGNMFAELTGHLTDAHSNFLKHWDKLVDLEAKVSQVSKKELLHHNSLRRESRTNSLSSMILDPTTGFLVDGSLKNGRYIYYFLHRKSQHNGSTMHLGEKLNHTEPEVSRSSCTLRCGDYVVLSTESGRIAVANGIISDISQFHVSVSFTRRLRLPGNESLSESRDLLQEFWRIDKDESSSSYGIMRFNLIQLFTGSSQSVHLRKMIVDLQTPRFDSGGMFSQDPAIAYIRSEKSLNDDQRRAIHKVLAAKDYALILGMPGTGKTSTMVHAVKALLMRGASILLTSYTNSAVDNLLIKLKAQDIDFVRIGRPEAVHDDVRGNCFSAIDELSVDDIKRKIENVRVIGVTCLGINNPLLTNKKFDVCIMDEAGQTTLPVSLGPLMLASTFVLVGDHYQLPPLVQSTEARENGMGISLFCRLSEAHPQAISALRCQYRMCAGIMELSNALIYGNRLRCGSSEIADAMLKLSICNPIALWLKEVLNPDRSVIFIDTDKMPAPENKERGSVNNPLEAFIVSEITRELVKRNISGDEIGVITPYNSQANLIHSMVGAHVEIHTIDKYQGRDKDCILVSFVRSSEKSRACSSSLLGDWHRINVALTRAKKKLIMVGSCNTLSKVPLLKLLIEKVDELGGIQHVFKKDIPRLKQLQKCSLTSGKLSVSP